MAHNEIRLTGYVIKEPKIHGETVMIQMRTVIRDTNDTEADRFSDVTVASFGDRLAQILKGFRPYDFIDVQGTVYIARLPDKEAVCPYCGKKNHYPRALLLVIPSMVSKLNSLAGMLDMYEAAKAVRRPGETLPTDPALFLRRYNETSNQAVIIGRVASQPEMDRYKGLARCRYQIAIDSSHLLGLQEMPETAYPWVCTSGQQAERDFTYLRPADPKTDKGGTGFQGSLIMVDAFCVTRMTEETEICDSCSLEFALSRASNCLIPYSVEYLDDFLTDEDIAEAQALESEGDNNGNT